MEYIDVAWQHQDAHTPIRLVSELNEQRFETRKLEFFPDGKVGHASRHRQLLSTELGIEPVPPLDVINQLAEFRGIAISAQEFEALWIANVTAGTD